MREVGGAGGEEEAVEVAGGDGGAGEGLLLLLLMMGAIGEIGGGCCAAGRGMDGDGGGGGGRAGCCCCCCFGREWRRRGRVFHQPLPEEAQREPVGVAVGRGDALAARGRQRQPEELALGDEFSLRELLGFVLDQVEHRVRDVVPQLAGARRPLADDVDEGFGEDDLGAGEVAELQVRRRVLGDLLPEARLELQQVVVDAGPDDFEGVVHVGEREQGFALDVGFGDVEGVEGRGVVVEDAEEVVVIADQVAVGSLVGDVRGGVHGGEGAEEGVGGGRRGFGGDGGGTVGLVAAEEG